MNSYKSVPRTRRWTTIWSRGSGRKLTRLVNSLLIALLLYTIVPARIVRAQTTPPTVYTFVECEHIEEASLRDELNEIAQSVFEDKQSGLDVESIVNRNWIEQNLDAAVDTAVDEAIEQVSSEESWWSRVRSGWSVERAEELAKKVGTLAFGSDDFRGAVEQLSLAVADELAVEIQVMVDVSASSALLCVEEFIGASFSTTMAKVLEKQIRGRLASITIFPELEANFEEILKGDLGSIGGLGIIVTSQLSKALAQKVAGGIVAKVVTRILGKAASAVVPVAGWVVGIVLILWDLWEAGKGALPQIEKDFKGGEVKTLIRDEISKSVDAELKANLPKLARTVADDMFKLWQAFLKEFDQVLEIARTNPDFRSILDGSDADNVSKLQELVAVGTNKLGDGQLADIILSGQFKLILDLPPEAVEILRFEGDPDLVIEWGELAGNAIDQVVTAELYQFSSPSDFKNREDLDRVLALSYASVIRELMSLDAEKRDVLLRLSPTQTRWILVVLTEERVNWLAEFLRKLTPKESIVLVDYIRMNRGLISKLIGTEKLRTKFPFLLRLSVANSRFQSILNSTTTEQIQKLSELVAVSGESLKPEQLAAMIDTGQFELILALPIEAFEILRRKKDPSLVIEWAALAGEAVVQVVETGLFHVATPSDFNEKKSLSTVIALQNHEAISKVMLLERADMDILIELPTLRARAILIALTVEDLSWLAGYLRELKDREADLIAESILHQPGLLNMLKASENLRAKYPEVLTLAYRSYEFRKILNNTGVDRVEKLSNLVAIAAESLTPLKLENAVITGQIEGIFALPEAAFEILKEKEDTTLVLDWAVLAGEKVEKVVETELFRVASPFDFSGRVALNKVLALEEPEAVRKLMQLHQIERVVLLGLETVRARSALITLSLEDLSWLALFLAELPADEKDPIVEYILQEQGLIPTLKDNENVRTKFPRVLMLSLNLPRFEDFLTSLSVDELEKLSELVSAAEATMTPENLAIFLESDQLIRIFSFPQGSFDILRVTGNPALVLEWSELAGEALVEVVETGLYLVAAPNTFQGRPELESVLAIENPVAIQRLMNLGPDQREAILQLSPEDARSTLLSDLSEEELSWLAGYLHDLPALAQQLLAYYVVQKQDLIPKLRDSEELQEKFPRVLDLALIVPHFRNILDNVSAKDLGKLSELVVVAKQALDSEQLSEFVASRQFEHVFALPQAAFEILKWSKDPALVIAWADLAEEDIIGVVSQDLHTIASPDQFRNPNELGKALDLQDIEALRWVVQQNHDDRSFLLTSLSVAEVQWLFSFKSDLTDDTTVSLARFINLNPALMSELDIEKIGQSFMFSQNPEAILTFVSARTVEPATLLPTITMFTSASEMISGDLPNALYSHYYLTQWLILLTALLVLAALSISGWRLLRRRQLPEIWDRIRRPKGGRP